MAPEKDCPLCGTAMTLTTRRTVDRVPGTSETKVRQTAEWVCPECDYFEEEGDDQN